MGKRDSHCRVSLALYKSLLLEVQPFYLRLSICFLNPNRKLDDY